MNVVDLCATNDLSIWSSFRKLVEEAACGADRNAKNYIGLEDKVHDHDAFHVLMDGSEVIGFAGLYNNGIYPDSIARVLNRAYYAKSIRQTGLPSNKDTRRQGGLLAKYVLPEQVDIARQKRQAVFFSVESNTRKRTIDSVTKWINEYDRTYDEVWNVLPDMYFTCPQYYACLNDPTCWQNVSMLTFLDGFEFPLKRKTRDEWIRKFDN